MPATHMNEDSCRIHGNHNTRRDYLRQTSVTPTKRRGPIAAEFSSPGPAIVCLPSTFGPNRGDRGKCTAPSYSFGARFEDKKEANTPGPGEYDIEGLSRTGRDWVQSAFVGAKIKYPQPFITPSPSHYSPEKSISTLKGRQAPSYTFGSRTKESIADITPAPTAYNIPEPETYKIQKQPMYTFRPKTQIPTDKSPKPGPADYAVEKVWIDKISPPNVTFGSRPSPYALSF